MTQGTQAEVEHVKLPTRGRNILDLVLTSEENMVEDLEVREPIANSDHNLIVFRLIHKTEEEEEKKIKYNYDKANYEIIKEKLDSMEWGVRFEGKSVQDMWEIFRKEVIELRDTLVPIVKVGRYKRVYPKWMTRKIKKLIKKKIKRGRDMI